MDLDAMSGIAGSISIACWVVVFSPQIIENFRRSSAEGLSIAFIIIWLAGDIFNIAGALLQGVLPTMVFTFSRILEFLKFSPPLDHPGYILHARRHRPSGTVSLLPPIYPERQRFEVHRARGRNLGALGALLSAPRTSHRWWHPPLQLDHLPRYAEIHGRHPPLPSHAPAPRHTRRRRPYGT